MSEPTKQLSGCPVLEEFDPLDPAQVADPYPVLSKARREVPVFFVPDYDMWCVTRYEDIETVLRDTETYTSADFVGMPEFPPEIAEQLPEGHPLEGTLAAVDPPEHTRIRRIAQKAFSARQAMARSDEIRALAHGLIDGFADQGKADLATAYCNQLPIRVVAPVLGIPSEEGAELYKWAMEAVVLVANGEKLPADLLLEYGRDQVAFDRYIRELIAERRRNPRGDDDLITTMIFTEAEDGQPALSDHEIVGVVASSISAGGDTSATTIAHCVRLLLSDRTAWEEVVADPSLVPSVVEEALRLRPAAISLRRRATRGTVLDGVEIPEGARLFLHIGSGSHDEAVFERPEEFDLHRPNAHQHLAFGKWTHFCLGAALARTEVRIGLEALVDRLPSLRLVPGHELQYFPSMQAVPVTGGLVVEWEP